MEYFQRIEPQHGRRVGKVSSVWGRTRPRGVDPGEDTPGRRGSVEPLTHCPWAAAGIVGQIRDIRDQPRKRVRGTSLPQQLSRLAGAVTKPDGAEAYLLSILPVNSRILAARASGASCAMRWPTPSGCTAVTSPAAT